MPKLSPEDANVATCILLAVNPASDRLEETLSFLSDYAAWQLAEEEAPLFFQGQSPAEGSFEAEVYHLYRNGKIAFAVEEDIYMEGFSDWMDGKKDLEEYIQQTERKLQVYFGE